MAGSDPMWLSFLKSNSEAVGSFLEFLAHADAEIMGDMRTAIAKDKITDAKIYEGELRALDKLRRLTMQQEREQRDAAEYEAMAHGANNVLTHPQKQ